MKNKRSWKIIEMKNLGQMIVTTLADGTDFAYPADAVTSLSEWIYIVNAFELDRLRDLMDESEVYERPDSKVDAE